MGYYNDGELTGQNIYDRYKAGDRQFRTMGRAGGLYGDSRMLLPGDISTGRWRDQVYQVRRSSTPRNDNWFAIEKFIERVERSLVDEP